MEFLLQNSTNNLGIKSFENIFSIFSWPRISVLTNIFLTKFTIDFLKTTRVCMLLACTEQFILNKASLEFNDPLICYKSLVHPKLMRCLCVSILVLRTQSNAHFACLSYLTHSVEFLKLSFNKLMIS